ncbi:hypothetical protein E2562_023990 [Oryza meyeriana var. granulata]|uniref:Uncharacterized protein n=1 Tax=Oryza meyeriana var. granulata TaxID=110450 RepID=A0A6G1EB69_9ORYZ|nr:hypothetical protein E2562_023990 [Oryza meyeriana var. granulata]
MSYYSPLPEPTTDQSVATDVDLGACGGAVVAPAVDSENAVVLPPRAAQSSSSSPSARCRLGLAGRGRAGKRRPRPSKRVVVIVAVSSVPAGAGG